MVGQVEGSVYMGLGEALMEEQVFRKGLHKIPSMLDYKSPTTLEMPEVDTILVETDDPEGPYGAKEGGQGPLLPVIPAVANAVYDAVGVRDRRGADHAREGDWRRWTQAPGQAGAARPRSAARLHVPGAEIVESAFGQPAEAPSRALRPLPAEARHDAAAAVPYLAPVSVGRRGASSWPITGPRPCWWPAAPTSTRT